MRSQGSTSGHINVNKRYGAARGVLPEVCTNCHGRHTADANGRLTQLAHAPHFNKYHDQSRFTE